MGEDAREDLDAVFRRGAAVHPQPVAIALGHLLRSRNAAERVNGTLRAAEVLTRYVAAVAASSFAARTGAEGERLKPVAGPLSFGHFLTLVQQVAKLDGEHPAKAYLAPFRPREKGRQKQEGTADAALTELLTLRNDLGHSLAGGSDTQAAALLRERAPDRRLAQALKALEGLLACPLLVVESQQAERRRLRAVLLWLMGEGRDPDPTPLDLKPMGFECPGQVYVALEEQCLSLWPLLLWDDLPSAYRQGMFLVDSLTEVELGYQAMDHVDLVRGPEEARVLAGVLAGVPREAESVVLESGQRLTQAWSERRRRIEEAARQVAGQMPWDEFDATTMAWYARRLAGEGQDPRRVIADVLFDGRSSFTDKEVLQARMLFGTEKTVRRVLGRDLLDLRIPGEGNPRWTDRVQTATNVLSGLRTAVEFVVKHLHIEGATTDTLDRTSGTPDYLAMREALVNLFVHQDYQDPSAAAQVELKPQQAVFFNTGSSLRPVEEIVEGGRSQARNPVIAHALKRIGFAELAGSGIVSLQRAWREARRRPPRFESDRQGNTFTVTLDWRPVPDTYDTYWKQRIGARVSQPQATMLNLAQDPAGLTETLAVSATGLSLEEVRQSFQYLVRQVLLREQDGRYFIAEHLREGGA